MNKKVSLITTGRDDNYENDFIERFYISLTTNIESLKENDINFEYIIVDWCPLNNNFLHKNELLIPIYKNDNVFGIIVDNSVLIAENLYSNKFYEFFGKNVGMRYCNGDFLLLLNTDIILSDDLIKEIKNILTSSENTSNNFYRTRYRYNVNKNDVGEFFEDYSYRKDLYEPNTNNKYICGGYAGDFLFIDKNTMITKGGGYDEVNPQHRIGLSQASMDGEVLWNLYNKGVKLQYLEQPYFHITHNKTNSYDGEYNTDGYINKPDWGFQKYPSTKIDNLTYIKST